MFPSWGKGAHPGRAAAVSSAASVVFSPGRSEVSGASSTPSRSVEEVTCVRPAGPPCRGPHA
eukprot:7919241-Pyramimonas_sp.AAC.1